MPFFPVDPEKIQGAFLPIEGEEAHHIRRVLRLGVGDCLRLFDGAGYRYRARIVRVERRRLLVKLLDKSRVSAPLLQLSLIQCLPRLDKMDLIVQKAVELGVSRIVPALSERCRSIAPARLRARHERWLRIAAQAGKQCGQAYLPQLQEARELKEILRFPARGQELRVLLWEEGERRPLRRILAQAEPVGAVCLVVGPEGGFSAGEVEFARSQGWLVAGLGPRILRLETAAIVALGIVQYELGDFSA